MPNLEDRVNTIEQSLTDLNSGMGELEKSAEQLTDIRKELEIYVDSYQNYIRSLKYDVANSKSNKLYNTVLGVLIVSNILVWTIYLLDK